MKHNHIDNFIQSIESIKMTQSEKNAMREELVSFAVHNAPVTSPYHNMMFMAKRSFALAFVVIFSIASFSNAATKNALPGDIFYPVKIAHEEIALATTFGTSKKITYEIRRTEKRIQEATLLAQNSDIETSAEQISVVENIKKQTSKVKQHIEDVKKDNPEEALLLNSELKSTVKINQEALRKINSSAKEASGEPMLVNYATMVANPNNDQLQEDTTLSKNLTNENSELGNNQQSKFVDSLLNSLDEEVRSIEAFEDNVEEEILEKDQPSTETTNTQSTINTESEMSSNNEGALPEDDSKSIDLINSEIKSLENIVEIKKSIKELKSSPEMHIHTFMNEEGVEEIFNEATLRREADELIANKKYKQAFLKFQEILEHLKNEKITENVEGSLGISVPDSNDKEISQTTKTTTNDNNSNSSSTIKNSL